MATVGRARQTAESLINSQLPRALYGEASEKDNLRFLKIVFLKSKVNNERSFAQMLRFLAEVHRVSLNYPFR